MEKLRTGRRTLKLCCRAIVWESLGWINWDRNRDHWRVFVNPVMSFRVPLKVGIFLVAESLLARQGVSSVVGMSE